MKIKEEGELSEKDWSLPDNATAIIFGSLVYMGMVSWQFKKFADASSKRCFNMDWKDKNCSWFYEFRFHEWEIKE